MKAVAYIPEFKFEQVFKSQIKLATNLHLLPEENASAKKLREKLISLGFKLSGGSFVIFDGTLKDDGTIYEIFQGYALALTFFQPKGRASCRAIMELNIDEADVDLFIDEYDKFGYEPDDVISVGTKNIAGIELLYKRVEAQLETKDFNPLRNSLEFFILFLAEKPIRTRLLYLSICMESILLEGENEGLSYKLGMRCANLLNSYYENVDMEAIFQEIKNSYTLRSKIIHGDDYRGASNKIIRKGGSHATELDHVLTLETVVKDILSIIFSNEELYDLSVNSTLGGYIDKEYILDS